MYRPDGSSDMQISTLRLSVGHTGLLRALTSTCDFERRNKLCILLGTWYTLNFLRNFTFLS